MSEILCRICLQQEKMLVDVFEEYEGREIHLSIAELASIRLAPDDGLSNFICYLCLQKLDEAISFKKLVEESERTARRKLAAAVGIQSEPVLWSELKQFYRVDKKPIKVIKRGVKRKSAVKRPPGRPRKVPLPFEAFDLPGDFSPEDLKLEIDETKESVQNYRFHPVTSTEEKEVTAPKGPKWPCCMCSEGFRKKHSLQNHILSHHPILPDEYPCVRVDKTNYSCEFCRRHFYRKRSLKEHFSDPLYVEDAFFTCLYCGKLYDSMHALRDHEAMQHSTRRDFICDFEFCGKAFKTKAALNKHRPRHFNQFECHDCGFIACHKGLIKSHITRIHLKMKPHTCQHCQKAFASQMELRCHKATNHGYEKKFKCSYCEKAYAWSSDLKRHLTEHTGNFPFHCQFCGKPYNHRHNLNCHEKNCGRGTTRPPIERKPQLQMATTAELGGGSMTTYHNPPPATTAMSGIINLGGTLGNSYNQFIHNQFVYETIN